MLEGRAHATCGGRWLNEDLVDFLLTLYINAGKGPRIRDGVDSPIAWSSKVFPYMAPPNRPEAAAIMIAERPLTDGAIALLNLGAQIDALEPEVRLGRAPVETRVGLVELISLRGLIVGRIADYVRAEEIAEQLVRDAPTDARAFVARARTRASFHRFDDALADLDRAERLSLDAETANCERAAIFQAVGRYDEALALREEAARARQALKTSRPLSACMPSAAKSKQRNDGTRKAAAATAAFRRFRLRFSTSNWDSCG